MQSEREELAKAQSLLMPWLHSVDAANRQGPTVNGSSGHPEQPFEPMPYDATAPPVGHRRPERAGRDLSSTTTGSTLAQ